jgi:hypothetical protein
MDVAHRRSGSPARHGPGELQQARGKALAYRKIAQGRRSSRRAPQGYTDLRPFGAGRHAGRADRHPCRAHGTRSDLAHEARDGQARTSADRNRARLGQGCWASDRRQPRRWRAQGSAKAGRAGRASCRPALWGRAGLYCQSERLRTPDEPALLPGSTGRIHGGITQLGLELGSSQPTIRGEHR